MAYTKDTITTGTAIEASWGNKIETNLERLGNCMGVVDNVAALPAVGTVADGDWYWCKAERLAKMKVGSVYLSLNSVGEVASSAPTSVTGLLWYDTTNKVFNIYTGSAWVPISESRIDNTLGLDELKSELIVNNPTLLLSTISNSSLWDYFLKDSDVRAEVLKKKMYIDAILSIGSTLLAADTNMEQAILGSIGPLSIALSTPSFWLNTSILTYWMNNYWTKNNYSSHATTTVASINSKYGFRITADSHWVTNFPYFSIDLDLTAFNSMSLWYNFTDSGPADVKLYIGANLIKTFGSSDSGTYSADISGYSGVQTVKFLFNDAFTFDFTDFVLS